MSNNKNGIAERLKELQASHPSRIIGRLERGLIVPLGGGLSYEIDDPLIYKRLKYDRSIKPGQIPLRIIYEVLRGKNRKGIIKLFGDRRVIPFSEAFEEGLGECADRAILTQLYAQENPNQDSFLINGGLELDTCPNLVEPHMYNAVIREQPYLVDPTHPLVEDKENFIPYATPIEDLRDREFHVQKDWKQGRTYLI